MTKTQRDAIVLATAADICMSDTVEIEKLEEREKWRKTDGPL